MADPLAYRVPEAADAIGVSRSKAYELIAAGAIPSIRIGKSIRVPVVALQEWIASMSTKQAETRAAAAGSR